MNIDLFKYIMKLLIVPMMFVSLLLITYGDIDTINGANILGFILLIISSIAIIINNNENENEQNK